MATALPRRAAGWLQKGAGDIVHCGGAALALMEMHHGSDPALQGAALVLTGMVQSQEQHVALLSTASPSR